MSMKDIIRENVAVAGGDKAARLNMLREFLQALVLKFIEEKGYSKELAFVGGTALRFIYGMQRFSEDLDFSLISGVDLNFEKFTSEVINNFETIGISAEQKARTVRNVKTTLLKFPGLMFENGLTHRKDQKILIKLDIDSRPPLGFTTEVSFIQKLMPTNVVHFDLPSLFAGKLHAVLMRQYTKGRDFYDFMWFVGQKISPNYDLLMNTLFQTTRQRFELDAVKLKKMLKKRIETVDWGKAAGEVRVFLVNKDESKYITRDVFDQLIEKAAF